MKRIPYGESNFDTIVSEGSFLVDKTGYIRVMERLGKHITFLRPRRFGKSLWVSTLRYYYGMEFRQRFSELFGHLNIGWNPTPGASQYLVLKFDFSGIDTTTAKGTFDGFLRNVREGVDVFLHTYQQFFPEKQWADILKTPEPACILTKLFKLHKSLPGLPKIYVLVDEYDRFANDMIAFNLRDSREAVSQNGFVRKAFETIKTATQDGVVDGSFLTGVSPVTLDSMTSGFNISRHLTTHPLLHDMLGFTAGETAEAMRNAEATEGELPELMEGLARWYDGYRFHPKAPEALYNTDLVLYFAAHYCIFKEYPEEMLDPNIASDFSKIRQTFRIGDREQANRESLDEVLTEGHTLAKLTAQYSLEREFTGDDFKSLLFYLGYLTIDGVQGAEWRMKIPNQVIRELYWDYFATLTTEATGLTVNTDQVIDALRRLVHHNDPMPFAQLVGRALKALSNRDDMGLEEKHLKAMFAAYLSLSSSYLMRSEFETQRQYVDVMLLTRPPFEMPYQFAFELKYVKKSDAALLKTRETEAEAQLKGYVASPELASLKGLQAWIVVYLGTEVKVLRQV